jgi:hypothetical protein
MSLRGLECWSIVAGATTGSAIHMQFGPRRLRDRPVENPALREDQRLYESDHRLYVRCAWRVETSDRVLCVWSDFDDDTGAMPGPLQAAEGHRVVGVDAAAPSWDLRLDLGNDTRLVLFCDASSDDRDDNYRLRTPGGTFVVGANSRLRFTPAS